VPSPGARGCPALTRRDDILEILVWPSRSFDFIIMALIASTAGKPAMAERALLAKIQTCIGLPSLGGGEQFRPSGVFVRTLARSLDDLRGRETSLTPPFDGDLNGRRSRRDRPFKGRSS
jgi:hypothetical protein